MDFADSFLQLIDENGIFALMAYFVFVTLIDAMPKAGEHGAPTHWAYIWIRTFLVAFTGQMRSAFNRQKK